MSELQINQLIKIIIGVVVVVVVVGGLYLIFKDKILSFFEGLPTGKVFLNIILGI